MPLAIVSSGLPEIFRPIPIALVIHPVTLIDNVPAATVGFETAIDVTRHFAVVPELRAHMFSLSSGAASGFAIRPGVVVRWVF